MSSDESQFVSLCLGAEVFAVPVTLVREILDHRDCFRLPEGPHYLLGLIDLRRRQNLIRCLAKRSSGFIVVPDLERLFNTGCEMDGSSTKNFTQH